MKLKDKILVQIVMCVLLFAMVKSSQAIDRENFITWREKIKSEAEKHYSVEEVKTMGLSAIEKLTSAPATLASVVIEANEGSQFGEPMDEKSSEQVQAVHAVSGGKVIYAGIDKELGPCIRIQHQEKISTYGNLYTLTAITGERVKKGDIVGTFDNQGSKEFYYQLEDNVI